MTPLVDTSAWIEYLRATGSAAHLTVRGLLERDAPLATTDVIVMEVLAGGRDAAQVTRLRGLLGRCTFHPTIGLDDFEAAADLYRTCRRRGETVRALNDCLIGAVAVRIGTPILHADRDFGALARCTHVRLYESA